MQDISMPSAASTRYIRCDGPFRRRIDIRVYLGEHGSHVLATGLGVERPGPGHIVNPGLDYIGIHLVSMARTHR